MSRVSWVCTPYSFSPKTLKSICWFKVLFLGFVVLCTGPKDPLKRANALSHAFTNAIKIARKRDICSTSIGSAYSSTALFLHLVRAADHHALHCGARMQNPRQDASVWPIHRSSLPRRVRRITAWFGPESDSEMHRRGKRSVLGNGTKNMK